MKTEKRTSKKGSVLVVDDEEIMREVLETLLTAEGYRVDLAKTGEEGLEAYGRRAFDVVLLDVSMPGIGIAPENVAKIYDPFYTTKGVGQGTGLGLAVTYGIVQEHTGRISVESTPGRGTTFHITLPSVRARARLQAVGD